MSMLAKHAMIIKTNTINRLPSSCLAYSRISLVVRLKKMYRHWAQNTRENTSQRIMVRSNVVMYSFWTKHQTMPQASRAIRILLIGWRLVKNRDSGERAGMPESVFAFAFANGKSFVCRQVRH